jgi:GWxTD domain-containing protein
MSSLHSTIRVGLFLLLLLGAESILAQKESHHACFEQPYGARDAIHRLPENFYYWLAEDAVFIISPEERCAFLHLNTDEEREQFIEQFWYRRTVNPDSPNEDFKIEHYRRIASANQKYGSGLVGWKTDRGRTYVVLGPPDSVDLITDRVAPGAIPKALDDLPRLYATRNDPQHRMRPELSNG